LKKDDPLGAIRIKYDKQDQQGKPVFNERNPTRPSNKNQRQGAQEDLIKELKLGAKRKIHAIDEKTTRDTHESVTKTV
jgi:hypothetical protein